MFTFHAQMHYRTVRVSNLIISMAFIVTSVTSIQVSDLKRSIAKIDHAAFGCVQRPVLVR